MELREVYRAILETLGYVVDERGTVSTNIDGTLMPVLIRDENNKQLVVPFDSVLRDPHWDVQVAFHPLSENVIRTDSSVFKWLQNATLLYLNVHVGIVMSNLVHYCSNPDAQKTMNHKQNAFLKLFPDADATAYENWEKLRDKIGGGNLFVKVITLRNKKLNNEAYHRTTLVTFPFYNECMDILNKNAKERVVFGVKLRKRDVEGFVKLFEFIFQGIQNVDANYSFGSRSMIAPSFHSLVNSLGLLAKDIHRVARLLKMDDVQDLQWTKSVEDLTPYRGLVPPLEGNEGNVTETERRQVAQQAKVSTPVSAAPKTTPVASMVAQQNYPTLPPKALPQVAAPIQTNVAPVMQPVTAPQAQPQPAPAASSQPTSGKMSMSQLLGGSVAPQPYGMANPYMMQPQQYGMPMQPMQPMMPTPQQQAIAQRFQPVIQPPQPMQYPNMAPMGYGQPMMQPQPMMMQGTYPMNGYPNAAPMGMMPMGYFPPQGNNGGWR